MSQYGSGGSQYGSGGTQFGSGGSQSGSGTTGTDNVTSNLVSILYHCLEGAQTHDKYIQDAQQQGNNDVVQFFQQVKQEEMRRAEQCKQLLGQHLSGNMQRRRAA